MLVTDLPSSTGAEQRASDLALQLTRLQAQSEREITLLQASNKFTNTALHKLEAQLGRIEKSPRGGKKG